MATPSTRRNDLKPQSRHASESGLLESNAQADEAPRGRVIWARGRSCSGVAVDDRSHQVDRQFAQHQPLRLDLLFEEPTRVASTSHPVMLRDGVTRPS
jgi:hypothetical protein